MPKKILVVDDEAHIRRVIELKLRGSGYEVECATNAASALEKAKVLYPDLIVTDLRMPGEMTGVDLIQAVRATSDISETPVILLSGSIAVVQHLQESLIEVRNVTVLSKPFSPRNLVKQIREILDAGDEAKSETCNG